MLISHTRDVVINRLIVPATSFLVLIVIARKSDVLLGEYALVMTFNFIMQSLPMLGLTPFVMREVARQPDQAGRYLATIGALALLASSMVALSMQFGLRYSPYPSNVQQGIRVAAYAVVPGVLAFLAELVTISLHRARAAAVTATVENTLRLIASIYCVYRGYSVAALMWVLVSSRALALCMYLTQLTVAAGVNMWQRPSLEILRKVRQVLPTFSLYMIFTLVIARLDYLVLSVFENAAELGYYAVAYRLQEITMMGLTAVMTAVFPKLSRAYATDRDEFVRAFRSLLPVGLAAFCSLAMICLGFAESYVFLLFHKQYPHPVMLTQLFTAMLVLSAVDGLISNALQAADRQRFDLYGLMAGGFVYAAALFLLVPRMQGVGAFLALVAATFVQMSVRIIGFERTLGRIVNRARIVAIVLTAAITLAPVMWATRSFGIWAGPIVALIVLVVYPVLILASGGCELSRALAQFWRPERIRPLDSVPGVIDHIAEDTRAWLSDRNRDAAKNAARYENFGLLAVILLRWSRWAYLTGRNRLERSLRKLIVAVVRVDVAASSDIGPGLVLRHPIGTIITGRIGRNARLGPFTGIHPAGLCDVGAGPGMPVVGNGVEFIARVVIRGGVRIDDDCVIGPNTVVNPTEPLAEARR